MNKGMRRGRTVALWATTMLVSVAGVSVGWRPAIAQEAAQVYDFNIPAKPIRSAMNDIVRVSGIDVVFAETPAASATGNAVRGSLTPSQAVATLLSGTGLSYTFTDRNTVTISDISQSHNEVAPDGTIMLGTITIFGQGDSTEGSGLYTAARSSTATGLDVSADETPQSVTIITDQRIKDQDAKTVREALAYSAGITNYREGTGNDLDDVLYSRGFTLNNFQIDGAPASALGTGHNSIIYDRIDVVRGAAGLAAGMGSPGGTVNMMRKRPTAEPTSEFSLRLGSWDRYGASADISGALNEEGSIRGRLIVDVEKGGNWLDRYEDESRTVYGITEFDLDNGDLLTFGATWQRDEAHASSRIGHPLAFSDGTATDFARSTNLAPDWAYYDKDRLTAFAAYRRDFANGWTGTAELSFSRYKYDGDSYYFAGQPDPVTGAGTSIWPTRWVGDDRQVALNAHATGTFDLFGRSHDLSFGISVARTRGGGPDYGGWMGPWTGYDGSISNIFTWDGSQLARPDFVYSGDVDYDEHQYSAYMNSRLHLSDATKLFAGLRVIDWKRVSTTTALDGTVSRVEQNPDPVVVPYLALFHEFNDRFAAYASYTRIFNPTGSYTLTLEGKPLDPDEGSSYELGLKMKLPDERLQASFALFHTDQDKLAEWRGGGYVQRRGITSQGFEAELTGEIREGWNLAASYTYTKSESSDGLSAITAIPRHSVKLFTTWRAGGKWEGLTLGGGLQWQSETGYDLTNPAYYRQKSYAVVDAMASYDFSDSLSATLHVKNLFDKVYYTGSGEQGFYGAPRSISLNLTSRF